MVGMCSGMNGLIIFFLINGPSVLVLDIGTGAGHAGEDGVGPNSSAIVFVGRTFFLRNTLLTKPLSSTERKHFGNHQITKYYYKVPNSYLVVLGTV